MTLDSALLAILACPEDKRPLYYIESESVLYNPRLQAHVRDPRRHPGDAGRGGRRRSTDAENDRLAALVQDLKIAPTFDEKDS